MSMGNAKKGTVVDADGNKRTSRIPQKPLNQFIKAALLTLLKRDDISIKDDIRAGSNTITVLDSNGKYLFSCDNAWDYGYYRIFMANPKEGAEPLLVAEMDWYENDGNTNQQQQDIFDIADALRKKMDDTMRVENGIKTLTAAEQDVLNTWGIHGNTAR